MVGHKNAFSKLSFKILYEEKKELEDILKYLKSEKDDKERKLKQIEYLIESKKQYLINNDNDQLQNNTK